jgi:hypothetical protein
MLWQPEASGTHWGQVKFRLDERHETLLLHQPQPCFMLHSVQESLKDEHTSTGAGAAVTGCAVEGAAAVVAATADVGGRITGQMEHKESLQQLKKPLTAFENKLKVPKSCKQMAPPPRENCRQQ